MNRLNPRLHSGIPERFAAYFDFSEPASQWHMEKHRHNDYYELLYILEGETHIRIRGNVWRAGPGDLAIYHPGMEHEETVQPGKYRIICMRFADKDMGGGVGFPGPDDLEPVFRLPWKERFRNICEQVVTEFNAADRWSQVLIGTYLTQFTVLLWRALDDYRKGMGTGNEENMLRMGRVIDLIHSSIDADMKLSDLADKAFMSEGHFSQVFKGVTGLAPKRYLIHAKIEKACELLSQGRDSVTEIALTLGYDNMPYFTRLFKKETGMTPVEYRRTKLSKSIDRD